VDGTFWLNLVMRWLHVTAAVAGVGGTLMMRFVILPALSTLPNGGEILDRIRPLFKKLIHSAMGILLLTGFYNYLAVAAPKVKALKEQGIETLAAYHPVMGVKIILSLVLFTIAIMLLMPVPAMHEKRKTWLTVNAVLGLTILLLAAFLRRLWP
jgi:uncharacterized membrane protein